MPDCNENYETEISEGRNLRTVKCKFCRSVILKPSMASFATTEVSYLATYLSVVLQSTLQQQYAAPRRSKTVLAIFCVYKCLRPFELSGVTKRWASAIPMQNFACQCAQLV